MRNKTPLRGFLSRRVRNQSDTRAIFPRITHPKLGEDGFTISELLIVIILTGLFTMIIMIFSFDLWHTAAIQEANLDTLLSRFNASDTLREEIGTSSGLIIQNSIADANTLV